MGIISSKRLLKEEKTQSKTLSDCTQQQDTNSSQWFNNREFKAIENPNYMLPGDGQEVDRLHIQHVCVRAMFNSNFNAPVANELERGITVLDVGCGPGLWVTEMARDYPNTTFEATDIADVFRKNDVPENITFTIANTLKGLPFPDDHFDYIFQRCMLMSFSVREWNIAINELMRVLKPGGFLELVESDLRIYDAGPATAQWNRTLYKVMRDRDFSPRTARHLPDLLLRHGTRNVHGEHRSCPMNWLGRLGQLMFEDMELAFEALKTPMLRSGSYTDVLSYDRSVDMARGEFANFKSWVNFYAAYGMKPL